jgi:hypothetical protein
MDLTALTVVGFVNFIAPLYLVRHVLGMAASGELQELEELTGFDRADSPGRGRGSGSGSGSGEKGSYSGGYGGEETPPKYRVHEESSIGNGFGYDGTWGGFGHDWSTGRGRRNGSMFGNSYGSGNGVVADYPDFSDGYPSAGDGGGVGAAKARLQRRTREMEMLGVSPSPKIGVGSAGGRRGREVGQLEFYSSSPASSAVATPSSVSSMAFFTAPFSSPKPRMGGQGRYSPISFNMGSIGSADGVKEGYGQEDDPVAEAAAALADGTTIVRPVPRWLLPYQRQVVTTLLLLLIPLSLWGAVEQIRTFDDGLFAALSLAAAWGLVSAFGS